MSKSKHILIDTSYLIFRSFFAYPHLNKGETPVGALYGFVKTIISLKQKFETENIYFALDLPTPTWRHKELEGYKAGRPELANELKIQFPIILDWIKKSTSQCISSEGFEADDIIKTMSEMIILENENDDVYIFSSDRDLYQLFVFPNVKFIQNENSLFDKDQFREKYEVEPEQWVDFKSYVGDNSDNLKGISGIGPKTASKLLQAGIDFTILNKYQQNPENTSEIIEFIKKDEKHQKLIDKILSEIEIAKQTYRLATLQFVDSINFIPKTPINFITGIDILKQYNFTSLLKLVEGEKQENLSDDLFAI
jgi:DNA polymerase I